MRCPDAARSCWRPPARWRRRRATTFLARVPGLVQGQPSMIVYEASPAG
ncbi:hypothetical protein AB0L25_20920 [Spirillospora sp. NPDC052242]